MATYSNNLRLTLIASGADAGTWGNTTNYNLGTLLESSVAGFTTVAVTATSQALTANNGVADEARTAMLKFTNSVVTSAFSVYAPPSSKQYIVWNYTAYDVTIYNSTVIGNTTAAGTGATIKAGDKALVISDGTNFYSAVGSGTVSSVNVSGGTTGLTFSGGPVTSSGTITAAGTLAVASGGTGVTTSTGTGSAVLSTSPALTTPSLSGETFSTTTGITAAGTNQGTATALTSDFSVVTTAASGTGVILPTATAGRRLMIVNRGANTLNIYPATGATIDALSANAAITLAVNGVMELNASTTTQWYSAATTSITGATISNSTITGGTINSLTTTSLGSNGYGSKTISTSSPAGGSNGDIWYKV